MPRSSRGPGRRLALLLATLVSVAPSLLVAQGTTSLSPDDKRRVDDVRIALSRLPYYGVFDFLAFTYERGTVTLKGFAYRGSLRDDAEAAVRRVRGIDTIVNEVEIAPVSFNDDRIRQAAFYLIYTDEFLSRYAPGGARRAYIDALEFGRFPGIQPLGYYPIHIVVKNGRITLMGMVDNEQDKQMAGIRAREVQGVFGVENELVVD